MEAIIKDIIVLAIKSFLANDPVEKIEESFFNGNLNEFNYSIDLYEPNGGIFQSRDDEDETPEGRLLFHSSSIIPKVLSTSNLMLSQNTMLTISHLGENHEFEVEYSYADEYFTIYSAVFNQLVLKAKNNTVAQYRKVVTSNISK